MVVGSKEPHIEAIRLTGVLVSELPFSANGQVQIHIKLVDHDYSPFKFSLDRSLSFNLLTLQ